MSSIRTTAGSALLAGLIVAGGGAGASVPAIAHAPGTSAALAHAPGTSAALAHAPGTSAATAQAPVAPGASAQVRGRWSWPVYNRGDRGQSVRTIQLLLRNFSSATRFLEVDGIFGPNTARAVRLYQESRGLQVDGVVGPRTWGKFAHEFVVRRGDRGPDVRAVQVQLRKHDYGLVVDGIFGPRTARAVRNQKRCYGLWADAVVGPRAWRALVSTGNHEPYRC